MNTAYKYNITKNDCDHILRQHLAENGFELIEYDEKSVSGEVVGIMSGHYKLITKARIGETIISNIFFVKRMRSQYPIQTQFIKEQGAYKKENFAYGLLKQVYEKYNDCDYMANCYLSVHDELFVFEDVTENGYRVNKCKDDILDEKHLKLALNMLAKFHAGSIIHENKQSAKIKDYKMPNDYSHFLKDPNYRRDENFIGDQFYKTCIKAVLHLIDIVPYYANNKREIRSKFLEQTERVYDLVKPSREFLNVICHGDLWNSNLLFKYDTNDDPIHCKILDFQAIRYTIPAHDYLYLVHANSFETDSRQNEVLSRFYYNALKKYLDDNSIDINKYMTYSQFLQSIDYIYPFVIVQNACFANLCIARLNKNISESEELFTKCMYEDRSDWCTEAYHNNEFFRTIVDQSLKYLITL